MNSKRELICSAWNRGWLLGLLLVLSTLAAYQPAWQGGFIWDDDAYVTDNPLLTAPDGLRRIWFSLESPSQYFPLTYTVFRFERALFGLNPTGYHLINILLHAANALLLWQLLRRLGVPGARLAAGIFALHPVEVESVAWITELKNVLSLFFCLLALLAWVEFLRERPRRPWGWYVVALLSYSLALFSKSTACTLPAALLLVLWLQRKPIGWGRLVQVVPFLVLGLVMGLLAMWWERYHVGTVGEVFALGPLERILIASRAVWFYASKLAWPADLTFSYPRWTINPADPLAYSWLLATAGLLVVIHFARRMAGRGIEVAVLFYASTLSPMLGFIMLYTFHYTFVADHYQYIASIGLVALTAAGIVRGLDYFGKNKQLAGAILCTGLLAMLGLLTWRQSGMYRDAETLWRTTLARNPGSLMAHVNLGPILFDQGKLDEAMAHFQEACQIQPRDADAQHDLGVVLLHKGRVDEAIARFQKAWEIVPRPQTRTRLGEALFQKGLVDEAIGDFRKALELEPNFVEARYALGVALLQKGQIDEGIIELKKTLEIEPGFATAWYNLGFALLHMGQLDNAIVDLENALRAQPDYAEARYYLGIALVQKGRLDDAATQFQKALAIRADYADARAALDDLLRQRGHGEGTTHVAETNAANRVNRH